MIKADKEEIHNFCTNIKLFYLKGTNGKWPFFYQCQFLGLWSYVLKRRFNNNIKKIDQKRKPFYSFRLRKAHQFIRTGIHFWYWLFGRVFRCFRIFLVFQNLFGVSESFALMNPVSYQSLDRIKKTRLRFRR